MRGRARNPLEGLTVLLVDDNHDQLDMLTAVLSFHGARVVSADDAKRALGQLDEAVIDVIVSDIAMPGFSGLDFIRAVRRREAGRNIPAIAVTAFILAEPREAALAAGFQVYLPKPVDLGHLVDEILRLTRRAGPT